MKFKCSHMCIITADFVGVAALLTYALMEIAHGHVQVAWPILQTLWERFKYAV